MTSPRKHLQKVKWFELDLEGVVGDSTKKRAKGLRVISHSKQRASGRSLRLGANELALHDVTLCDVDTDHEANQER